MKSKSMFLVFGATGRTGRHFVDLALQDGHRVRALVRGPDKLMAQTPNLEVRQGSILNAVALDDLLNGVDFVISMLGDAALQKENKINRYFINAFIPAMRRQRVKRFLYQAGGLTRRYKQRPPLMPWLLRNTIARWGGLIGQHEDNEAVIAYLMEDAQDIEWMVHRASMISDSPSKGTL